MTISIHTIAILSTLLSVGWAQNRPSDTPSGPGTGQSRDQRNVSCQADTPREKWHFHGAKDLNGNRNKKRVKRRDGSSWPWHFIFLSWEGAREWKWDGRENNNTEVTHLQCETALKVREDISREGKLVLWARQGWMLVKRKSKNAHARHALTELSCFTDMCPSSFTYIAGTWTDVYGIRRSVNFLTPCLSYSYDYSWRAHNT